MKKLFSFLSLVIALAIIPLSIISCDIEDGKDGKDGIDGIDGQDGEDGADGADGTNGSDASVYLTASKTPGLLTVTSDFVGIKITPLLSS